MSGGPRVSSGSESRQDYGTPKEFLQAVEQRFGRIAFDLAAHAANAKHERYFAPPAFTVKVADDECSEGELDDLARQLTRQGAWLAEALERLHVIDWSKAPRKGPKRVAEVTVPNHDDKAAALNSFAQRWHEWTPLKDGGLGYLNCEFADIAPWAEKCALEAKAGVRSGLLVPASIGSNWFAEHVAKVADVYSCGRMSFDGKNVYPKDLMFCNFTRETRDGPRFLLWDWKTDTILYSWTGGELRPGGVYGGQRMVLPEAHVARQILLGEGR